jgi:hypothetical protein
MMAANPAEKRMVCINRGRLRRAKLNLVSEMKTTDYTENTDTEDFSNQGLLIRRMNPACLAIP